MSALRAYLLSLFLVFGGLGVIPSAEAARYITTADNENNAGTGVPDNDMGSCIYNDDSRHPIEFNIHLSGALPTKNAYLSVFINDIDWPDEVDEIFLNGHSLGFAAGLNGVNNSTLFVLPDLSWVKAGKNLVQVRVDKNNVHSWCAAVVNGQLVIDEGLGLGPASIRSLSANAAAYNFGSAVNIDLDVDTVGTASQNVRLELILRDPNGAIIDFDRNSAIQSWPVTGSNNEPYRWAFTLPTSGTSGLWSVTLGAYDITTAELNATKTVSFAVPLTAASLPVVSGVTPATGSAGSAITISGQNFIQGGTTCTLGGMDVTNLVIVGGSTITGTVPALAAGLYALACSTRFGGANLPNAFTVAKSSQSITFGTAPTVTVGGTGTLSATASSGLAVALSSTTPGICTVSGSMVTGIAAGTCTIAANQAGNSSYNAAPQVTQSFSVTAVSGINCSTSAFPFSLCDEFSGTAINTSVWKQMSTASENVVGKSSSVHDGYLDLRQDETDNGGQVVTRFAPQKHLRVTLTHNMHAANDYFMPYLGIGPVASLGWVKSSYGPDYCSQASNFDRPRLIVWSTADSCASSIFSSVPSSSFYDHWSTAVVDYDMDTGLVTVDLDNDGIIDLQATVPLASRVPVTAVTLHGYGWWTGHWHRVDAIKIEGTPLGSTGSINDTGIDYCRDHATGADTPVTATTTCTPAQGGQDARYGRDAAASKASLSKVGGGGKGFDFTKIANSGTRLSASAALGSAVTDWACTYDNTTGLMWEVKSTSGLHNQSHSYTWYDSVHNYGGSSGAASGGSCQTAGRCDTEKFVADVNAAGLCGHNDWRMPTFQELNNLVDRGRSNPAIDPTYFPNTPAFDFWSGSPWAGVYGGSSDISWNTDFSTGYGHWNYRGFARQVRLVRAGQ